DVAAPELHQPAVVEEHGVARRVFQPQPALRLRQLEVPQLQRLHQTGVRVQALLATRPPWKTRGPGSEEETQEESNGHLLSLAGRPPAVSTFLRGPGPGGCFRHGP